MMFIMKQIIGQNIQVLDLPGWNFNVQSGECVYLSGPSGSGKTVLLRAVADLDPHQGMVELDGVSTNSMPAHDWRRKVALVPAETHWWSATVAGHMQAPDEELLAELGFEPGVLAWEVARLSSGEKQRLGFLRALQQNPEVLLLDEPTANLDSQYTAAIERYVAGLCERQGMAVIWVTHDSEQQQRIARRGWQITPEAISEVML